jgi:hypothetical protein
VKHHEHKVRAYEHQLEQLSRELDEAVSLPSKEGSFRFRFPFLRNFTLFINILQTGNNKENRKL